MALLGFDNPYSSETTQLLGLDPAEMRRQAVFSGLRQLGIAMMGSKNPALLGGAFANGVSEGKSDYQKQALAAYGIKRQQEEDAYTKQQRDEEARQKREQNAWLMSIPDGQERMYAQLDPKGYLGNKFAPPDAGGGSSNWGMSPIPVYNPKTGQYAVGQFNQGQGGVFVNGQPIAGSDWQPYDPYNLNQQKAAGTASGTQKGGAAAALPGAQIDAQAINDKIDMIVQNPDLPSAIGYGNALGDYFVSNNVLNIRSQLNELEGGAFMSAYSALKGGGQITEIESAQAKQAMADMQTARKMSDPEMFKAALERFRTAVNRGVQKLQAQAGQFAPGAQAPQGGAPGAPAEDPLGLR